MSGNVEELAGAVEEWKQAKYHLLNLVKAFEDSELNMQEFKEEFVEEGKPLDQELFKAVENLDEER
ncbi:MAG: hypothetical protein MUP58_00980 [Candidatus Nanohaloarchaeota archaeon QJJ-9]|nr:hypothetical protein [Candidatus Nanohaloarchaeota archaeon QJJ-9]